MKKYHSMISETLTFKTNIIGVTALFRKGKRRYLTNLHELFSIAHNKKMLKHSSTNIKISCINTVEALLETIISTKKIHLISTKELASKYSHQIENIETKNARMSNVTKTRRLLQKPLQSNYIISSTK